MADLAWFTSGQIPDYPTYTVHLGSTVTTWQALFDQVNVTFELDGNDYRLINTVDDGPLQVGLGVQTFANGSVTVDSPAFDAASIFSAGGELVLTNAELNAPRMINEGFVRVVDGGAVSVAESTEFRDGGDALVDGVGSLWMTTDLNLAPGAGTSGVTPLHELTISGGGQVSAANAVRVGNFLGLGKVTVDGPGSSLTSFARLDVGESSPGEDTVSGSVIIRNGATVTSGTSGAGVAGILGRFPSGNGSVTIEGAGSQWSNFGQLQIGDEGMGVLTVIDGGRVFVPNDIGFAGVEEGSHGTIVVTGAGSELIHERHQLIIGNYGTAMMTVSQGARVSSSGEQSATSTSGAIGVREAGFGVATVTGVGSQWENNNGALVVGFFGEGQLHVAGGGIVTSRGGFVGREPGSLGYVSVTGEDTQWMVSDSLYIAGNESHGGASGSVVAQNGGLISIGDSVLLWADATIEVSNGGMVNVGAGSPTPGSLRVGPAGTLSGSGTIQASVHNDGGLVAPGRGIAQLSITTDYVHATGSTLEVEISETGIPGISVNDVLSVAGNIDLQGGSLIVTATDGFSPSVGQSFNILDFDGLTGSFDAVVLPGGANNWDTSQLLSQGIITYDQPVPTEAEVSAEAIANATVQPDGPRSGSVGLAFFNVQGGNNGTFASYGVARFDAASIRQQLDAAFQGETWTIDAIDLVLTQANADFTTDGDVEILFTDDDDVDIGAGSSPLAYPHDDGEFPDAQSIWTYSFTEVSSGTTERYTLFNATDGPIAGVALRDDLLLDDVVTLLLADTSPDVAATYAGFTHDTFNGPTLTIFASLLSDLEGDYNADGVVDAADYTLWRDTLGSKTDLRADGDDDQQITHADYDAWRRAFGAAWSAAATVDPSTAVPEPPSLAYVLLISVIASFARTGVIRAASQIKETGPNGTSVPLHATTKLSGKGTLAWLLRMEKA